MQGFSGSAFSTQAFSPLAFSFGSAQAAAVAAPLGSPRIRRAGGKRRILTPDPLSEQLQKQLEDEIAAQQQTATQNHFAGVNKMVSASPAHHHPKRTRARREAEFFALLH